MEPLHDVPAVVLATDPPSRTVDLLVCALPHVTDVQVALFPVEAVPPRVAQAPCLDLLGAPTLGKGIGWWNGIRQHAVDVDAQDLAQQAALVLATVEWVAGSPSLARADVEIAVRPEANPASVV